jgi:hypothetical protein
MTVMGAVVIFLTEMLVEKAEAIQAWKIRKLCQILKRSDADELIASLRSVREASGIIDQLQAQEAEMKKQAVAQ